jgi:hypothetical protein
MDDERETRDLDAKRERVRKIVRMVVLFLMGATIFVVVFSWIVMKLWNWLAPELFGLPSIDQWQALGLLVLSKILFGGFSGGSGASRSRRRCERRRHEERLTHEERERLRAGLGASGGVSASPPAAPSA